MSVTRFFLADNTRQMSQIFFQARSTTPRAKRLLYIEDDVPVGTAGSGMPRTREIVLGFPNLAMKSRLSLYRIGPERCAVSTNFCHSTSNLPISPIGR